MCRQTTFSTRAASSACPGGVTLNVVMAAAIPDAELQAVALKKSISITAGSTGHSSVRPGVTFRPLIDVSGCTVVIGQGQASIRECGIS